MLLGSERTAPMLLKPSLSPRGDTEVLRTVFESSPLQLF